METDGNNEKLGDNSADSLEIWRYPRFFVNEVSDGGVVLITGKDSEHARTVLRMHSGDKAVICGADGSECIGVLADKTDIGLEFRLGALRPNSAELPARVRLYQCVPKNDKFEYIVQKAVELGVSQIVPVISDRVISRPDEKTAAKKIIRFSAIAYEAAKQCGRGVIPIVQGYVKLNKILQSDGDLKILFYEGGGERLSTLIAKHPNSRTIDILIGSEGGFTAQEVSSATSNGWRTATLGKRILRADTAPVAALAIVGELIT